jgi:threonine/homoserine/homoserine lactone efflux protein
VASPPPLAVATGSTTYALLSVIGGAALLSAIPQSFVALRAIGAAYLALLACRRLWRSWHTTAGPLKNRASFQDSGSSEGVGASGRKRSLHAGFSQGFRHESHKSCGRDLLTRRRPFLRRRADGFS